MTDLSAITDLHLFDNPSEIHKSLVFPGPHPLPQEMHGFAIELLNQIHNVLKKKSPESRDFMLRGRGKAEGTFWRGRRDTGGIDDSVDGTTWYRLRHMTSIAPTLDTLPSPLPESVHNLLLHPYLSLGGLVYIIGAPGSGKTTTCSAAVVSRLEKFGGFAYTLEDPTEMPLDGWHGAGYCAQTSVDDSAWTEALKGVLRSQPAKTRCILYVGEIRDTECAKMLIRAASSGFLVFATGFGTDIVSGLDALIKTAGGGDDVCEALANTLRLVMHQSINPDLMVTTLAITDVHGQDAHLIRTRQLGQLLNAQNRQRNQLLNGASLFPEC